MQKNKWMFKMTGCNHKIWLCTLFSMFLLLPAGGCSLAPDYARPALPVPASFNSGEASGTGEATPLMTWRDFFTDKPMQQVIQTALENNRDLRISVLNIEKLQAAYRIQRADLLPTVNASGSNSNQHLPADLSQTGQKGMFRQYSVGLGVNSFELDLFGRVRNLSAQALQNYYMTQEQANSARISLIAQTASTYLQLVADREQYDLTRATMKSWEKNYQIVARKFEAGVASDLELAQAQTVLNEATGNLAASATRLGQTENALILLMGAPMPEVMPEVRRLADVAKLPDVPAGLPSELLERRPDIKAAEHTLMGANANIGAARANFFPSISLTGSLGKASTDFDNLFDGAAKTWSFIPQINIPIFDTGRNLARLGMAEADRDIAVASYEKSIQTAFREVNDALVQRQYISSQLKAQESLTASTGRSYRHASARYEAGVSAYLNVLDAQRSLFSAQSGLISTRLLRENNALLLYKSLGGGWDGDTAAEAEGAHRKMKTK